MRMHSSGHANLLVDFAYASAGFATGLICLWFAQVGLAKHGVDTEVPHGRTRLPHSHDHKPACQPHHSHARRVRMVQQHHGPATSDQSIWQASGRQWAGIGAMGSRGGGRRREAAGGGGRRQEAVRVS